MTHSILSSDNQDMLILEGTWASRDEGELKKALSSIPAHSCRLIVDLRELDALCLPAVQVLLVFIRHARSIPRPVEVLFGTRHAPQIRLWGLARSGWEHFFHGR